MTYDPNIHRRRSIRLKDYDYTQPGIYFITICTEERVCMFGEVVAGKMRLNRYGGIVWEEWLKTETIRPNVITDAFVVMPNHVHGIIGIHDFASRRGMARHAPTTVRQFGKPVPNSLPTIIGSFKSAVTKHINQQGRSTGTSVWQRGYYEHIVRNEHALNHIRRYIEENPLRWYYDRFYPDTTR